MFTRGPSVVQDLALGKRQFRDHWMDLFGPSGRQPDHVA